MADADAQAIGQHATRAKCWLELIAKFARVRELEGVCDGDERESSYRMSGEERTWNWDIQWMNGVLSRCLDALGIVRGSGRVQVRTRTTRCDSIQF